MKRISNYLPEVKDIYLIDEQGNVYSEFKKGYLKPSLNHKGYLRYAIKLKNGKERQLFIHRLLMICYNYIENHEEMQVNHIDGNKLNNNLNNLEWITNEDNMKHAVKNNLIAHQIGESNPCNKLSEQTVLEIIDHLLNKDMSVSDMAEIYNCSKSTIYAIKGKRNWRYLTKDINF